MDVKEVLCLFVGFLVLTTLGNDGWIGNTGTPRIEGKHPSIRMVEEVITIRIKRDTMTADCRFTFKNDGGATTARIGFPDVYGNVEPGDKPRSVYSSFASYVDGKRVRTSFVTGDNPENWQVKTVRFSKGQTRKVRNVYSVRLGTVSLSAPGVEGQAARTRMAKYVLATGRSWRGVIGKSAVTFEFEKSALARSPLRTANWTEEEKYNELAFWSKNKNLVLWNGPTAPRVNGRNLIFIRTNWEPSEGDDISLRFGPFLEKY